MEQNRAEFVRHPLGQHRTKENALNNSTLDQGSIRIVHSSIEHLHGPEEVPYGEDELVVVCLVRDGRPYVRSFVEHYRSPGVKHIFFLDNGSTDGTVEALKEHDDVTVLRSTLPFAEYKNAMRQYLIGRFGRGRWILCADIDELFDYPYSDIVGLGSLLGYLNDKGYTAVAAQILDMFPEEPLSEAAGDRDEPLKERHRFYDLSNISRKSFVELRHRFPNNTLESDEIEEFRGGIRLTIFGTGNLLTKFPLVFLDEKIQPFNGNSHWVDNARIADITCVLFHYKFLDGYFHRQAVRAVRERQHYDNSVEYKKYLRVLENNPRLVIKGKSARELESVNELVENHFLVVSKDYMVLVYEEECKKAADRPSQGEPGGPEDVAVFYEAKAEATVWGLRAQRLEQQLEELQEQNRREVEELRGRLARARKKNRNLTHWLQSIRDLRSLGLLNKLGRLWARVRGRKQ